MQKDRIEEADNVKVLEMINTCMDENNLHEALCLIPKRR